MELTIVYTNDKADARPGVRLWAPWNVSYQCVDRQGVRGGQRWTHQVRRWDRKADTQPLLSSGRDPPSHYPHASTHPVSCTWRLTPSAKWCYPGNSPPAIA